MQAHHKHYLVAGFYLYRSRCSRYLPPRGAKVDSACGGPGGIRTPVQDTVLFASYNHIIAVQIFQQDQLNRNYQKLLGD